MKKGSFALKGNRKDLKLMSEILANQDMENKYFNKYFYAWKEDRFGEFIFPKEKYFDKLFYPFKGETQTETNYAVAILKYGAMNNIYVHSLDIKNKK